MKKGFLFIFILFCSVANARTVVYQENGGSDGYSSIVIYDYGNGNRTVYCQNPGCMGCLFIIKDDVININNEFLSTSGIFFKDDIEKEKFELFSRTVLNKVNENSLDGTIISDSFRANYHFSDKNQIIFKFDDER